MKEKRISVEEAFGALGMERILEESYEVGRQPAGDQQSQKRYRQKTSNYKRTSHLKVVRKKSS